MGAEATLKMLLLGEDRSAGKTIRGVGDEADKSHSKFAKLSHAAGTLLVGGLLAGGAAMVKFGGQASDLAETQSKVAQIFGKDSVKALNRFADSADSALGQSKQTALDAAASFGIFGKSAGLTGDELVGFSSKMTTLASDMASFNNTSPEQAIEAIGAALRGEAEPIRAYGVMLDDAALKAEALSMGLLKPVKNQSQIQAYQVAITEGQKKYNDAVAEHGKGSLEALKAEANLGTARDRLKKATEGTIPPLTQQQKILAAQSAIMKQTSDQQGDFARTSDGLANKQRILKAELSNMTTELGQNALPVIVAAVGVLMDVAHWVDENQMFVGILVGVLGGLAGTVWAINAAVRAWTAVQIALNVVLTANPIGLVIVGLVALGAALVVAYQKSETFRNVVDTAWRGIATAVTFVWNNILAPVFQLWGKAVGTVMGVWADLLRLLGHVPGFGWAKDLADQLDNAADMAKNLNLKLDTATRDRDVRIRIHADNMVLKKGPGGLPLFEVESSNAVGTDFFSGGFTRVGERGPEIAWLPRGTGISSADQSARMMAGARGGGDLGTLTVVVKSESGEVIEQKLVKVKRNRNGQPLAFI